MDRNEMKKLFGFYQNELCQNILSYWLARCEDREYGGYINCFDNSGEVLDSYDKYTWSQGRFIWMFSRLAGTRIPIFSDEQRAEFLRLAREGAEFLMKYCRVGEDDWRCVFLMERDGSPKKVTPEDPYDMSIYADCFATLGLGMYAAVAKDDKAYHFAKRLYDSIVSRVQSGVFNTLPYPLSKQFRAHGIPMILDNTARELLRAALIFDREKAENLKKDIETYASDILEHFVDDENCLHEIIHSGDNSMFSAILGQHMNPGHTIEDTWFLLDAAEITGHMEWKEKIYQICLQAFRKGWDEEFGGILHFCGMNGGEPIGSTEGVEKETMTKQLASWGNKLWWVHSEALYSSLRAYLSSGQEEFLQWHEKVFDYTFNTFPNRNPNVREWFQICAQNGEPQNTVVALPVKDPFHITRNLILILELLYHSLYDTQ